MSVTPMKRLTVISPRESADALTRKLIRLRCVQVEKATAPDVPLQPMGDGRDRAQAERELTEIQETIALLQPYSHKKTGFFPQPLEVSLEEFSHDGRADAAKEQMQKARRLAGVRDDGRAEEARLRQLVQSLVPWQPYDWPLGESETTSTLTLFGTLPAATSLEEVTGALAEITAYPEEVSCDGTTRYLTVLTLRQTETVTMRALAPLGFVRVSFPTELSDTPDACRAALEERIAALHTERSDTEKQLEELAEDLDRLKILCDLRATEVGARTVEEKLGTTTCTALLSGWVPAREEKRVCALLENGEYAYELSDPAPGEDAPVLLDNPGVTRNFEWVLGMYSYPKYGTFDPTVIMSIFYFIIFGMMFADVGYGLMLVLGCFGAVHFLKPREGMKRFLLMFGYCGISCMIMGAIFGGWFGDLPYAILQNMFGIEDAKERFSYFNGLWFNPLDDPMMFLVASLGIGAVHLLTGMAIRFWILCREKRVWDAVCDILFYWVMFAGLALLFLAPAVGKWVTIAGAVLIVLTHGRDARTVPARLVKGLLGLYDLISYASDLLSYSRILALGLAAAVIGMVVNILGTMAGGGVVGFLALIVAFLLGHTLNLALNVLGTFVHTSRLQYIEFFGKFFEDGGTPFHPEKPSEVYTLDREPCEATRCSDD